MSTIFKNINVLDLASAADEVLEDVSRIENVNLLLYSKETSRLLTSVSLENINVRAEMPENSVLTQVNGKYEIIAMKHEKPLFIVVNGTVIIRPDATADQLENGIAGIIVNGKIFCPEKYKGVVQHKIVQHNGRLVSYMDNADLVSDNIRVDNNFLHTCQAGSSISFSGKIIMLDDIDIALLDEKLHKLEFLDKLVIREDLLPVVSAKIVKAQRGTIVTIPADTYYVEGDLMLDASVLRRINNRHIAATGVLRIESDVKPEELAASVDSLHSESIILCSDELKDEVLNKTVDPAVQVLAYSGKLRVNEGEYRLTGAELKYTKDKVAFINHGALDIAQDVDAQLLFDSIGSVINYGVINGNREQCGVIQTKLLINKGVVSDRDSEHQHDDKPSAPAADDGNIYISNANYLKL